MDKESILEAIREDDQQARAEPKEQVIALEDDEVSQDPTAKSMKEVYNQLFQEGIRWREEHTEKKVITKGARAGEVEIKIPHPRPLEVARILRKFCYFIFIGKGTTTDKSPLYIYHFDEGIYIDSRDIFNRLIIKFDSRLGKGVREEVYTILRTMTWQIEPFSSPDLIPVQNGIFDLKQKRLIEFSHKYAITSKIKTRYNPKARKPILGGWFDFDRWLESIACGDSEIVALLWQILHEAINPNYTRGKMAILYGEGNNGKGTFQSLILNLVGASNVATLRPDQFEGFHLASLAGKVCNIGDDISNKYLDEVSDLMSVVTGETILINPKHQQPFELDLKLFCLFSGNELPRARNKSQGWYRRLCIVPFNADFNGQKERPEIKNSFLKDRSLLEWILSQVLNLSHFTKFIEPKAVSELLSQYKKDNDYILAFTQDWYLVNGWQELPKVPVFIAKQKLEEYLEDIGIKKPNLYGFASKLTGHLNKETDYTFEVKNGKLNIEEQKNFNDFFNTDKLKKAHKMIQNKEKL